MKKLLLFVFYITSFSSAFCQFYGNEWINYDQQYIKFSITQNGIYRIDQTTLNSALEGIGVALDDIDPRNFQLFNKGQEEFIYIEGEGDGIFDASDFIEFYGRKNDGTFDANLFDDPAYQLHTFSSIISDTAVYFLTWNNSITNARLTNIVNDLAGAPAAEPYCAYQALTLYGSPYGTANLCTGKPYLEIYSSKYEEGEGFTSPKYSLSTYNNTVNTPNIYSGDAFTPELKTIAIGINEASHHVVINVNGVTYADTTFTGYKVLRYTFPLDNLLAANTVAFVSGPNSTDYQRYSYIQIKYPRLFDFDNASKINFDAAASGEAASYMELSDFNEKSTSPILYDLTAHTRTVAIVESDISKFHLPYTTSGNSFFASSQDITDILPVTIFTPVTFVDYTDPVNQPNYLIISHPLLFDDGTGTDWVDEYKNYRSSVAGGGYNAGVIDINQLYDQFAYGIKKHPLAIRNFVLYAAESFDIKPGYVLLVGKSFTYDVTRPAGAFEYGSCLVPTFGHPGSDNLLVSRPGDIVPEIPVGRLTAYDADDVRIYYEKIVDFETQQANTIQTVENKAWMKNVLHFAGGNDEYEQNLFDNFLKQYGTIISDTLYGGTVTRFNKLSTDPIYYSESEYIDSIIHSGVSLITFFGHSSSGSFDYNIGEPEEFDNEGKYFLVFGNGCNTSAIHGYSVTLSERYVFAEDRAAIAFLAASNFSIASSLNNYALRFYKELGINNYHNSIGNILKATADSLAPTPNIFDRLTIEHSTLEGDPAINLNNHPQPDYAIEAPYVYFEPAIISASDDTFYVNIVVTNLGMAIDSSYFVEIKRSKPDGTEEIFLDRFDAPPFRDTLRIAFATDALGGVGLNNFDIHIDNLNEIAEIDELNNILGVSAFIISDDAIPVYPVEFSIMNHVPEYFAASTANPFAAEKQYIIEADTTMSFNSPLHKQILMVESGGVIRWDAPPMVWINNTVYYWRISPDTTDGEDLVWRTSSFLYLPGDITGWNQSHYYQYLEDDYNNIELLPTRTFEFAPDVNVYKVATGIYPTTNWSEVTSYINGELIGVSACVNAGFVIFVVDPYSGDPWTTSEVGETNTGPYGDYYCTADDYERVIQFYTSSAEKRELLYQFMMNTVPDSSYVIFYSNNYPEFNEWLADTTIYGHSLFDAFTAYGATDILSLATFDYDRSYIFYAKKGDPSTKYELIGDEFGNKIEATFVIEGNWYQGDIETPLIGPAVSWDKVQWSLFSNDAAPVDVNSIDLVGVDYDGDETLLTPNLNSGDTTIAYIDPVLYPYLKLKLNTFDDSLRTPAQFNYWRVIYQPVPEAALNPNMGFVLNNDTVQQGETITMNIAVTNVSDYDMDSLLIRYAVMAQNNVVYEIPYSRQDSLLSDSTMISSLSFNSGDIPAGKNTLIIEVNPALDQPEQFHFNNLGYLRFDNNADIMDPLLDVTFDGVHILDGDIVSAKPSILVSLKDENTYLALADTALLNISIKYPDESMHNFYYDGVTMKFIPADSAHLGSDNTARVEMYPTFEQDGIYVLEIHGEDVTGNHAGDIDYHISFEVINKPMISNVFNYPNPFSTQTRFVFTLTGSEVPEYFKIQIMTVSGKVIREIMRSELGELHVGNNITEFIWDGTDQFGDQLANGLYLYRVVTKLHGQALDKYNTNTDQYFKSGFGKMYLVR